jgi:hypothetical protein
MAEEETVKDINLKDVLIGALAATVLFLVVGASQTEAEREEVAGVGYFGGTMIVVTSKGNVLQSTSKKTVFHREKVSEELQAQLALLQSSSQ